MGHWVTLGEDVFACELEGATTWAGDIVVGVCAVFEGVSGGEVVVGEASCTGCVELSMMVMVLLPSINSNEKGWVEGVVPGPRNAGHWSVSTMRVVPFESQSGETSDLRPRLSAHRSCL